MTHSDIIEDTAVNLASLSPQAKRKINKEIIASAAKEMLKVLGENVYEEYVSLFDLSFDRDTEFHLLDSDERFLRSLETAEAYFLLYFLSPALKELKENVSISPKFKFGEGEIVGSPIRDIMLLRQSYYDEGMKIIHEVTKGSNLIIVSSISNNNDE